MKKINIFWFRRDLRIKDNKGLYECMRLGEKSGQKCLPIFIFDKDILEKLEDVQDQRVSFIYETLKQLKQEFQKKGSDLKIYYGHVETIWEKIMGEFSIEGVFSNEDYEAKAITRDKKIGGLLSQRGINFYQFKDQCIFSKDDILKSDGTPYKVYTPYKNKWLERLSPEMMGSFKSSQVLKHLHLISSEPMIGIDRLGFKKTEVFLPRVSFTTKMIEEYKDKRDFPIDQGTSQLGVHLRFGTISIRKCVQKAWLASNHSWLYELIWREFFMQILYHFPHVTQRAFRDKYQKIKWLNNHHHFQAWREGKTGFPLVDAGMRELNQTGFMHNRVRMVAASFLIKNLLIDWRWGEKYFSQKLLDFDLASNNGNWQWVAGTGCDAAPYFRIFNPMTQLKKFDPDLLYIKKWIPEYGSDIYPSPIIDYKDSYQRAIFTYQRALEAFKDSLGS